MIKLGVKYVLSLLKTYFSETILSSQLVVTFEFSREKNIHIHTQVIALTKGDPEVLKTLFIKSAKNMEYPDFQMLNEDQSDDFYESDYLKIEMYSKSNFNKGNNDPVVGMVLGIAEYSSNFDLQFPRRGIADYIKSIEGQYKSEHIENWKKCVQSQKQEEQATNEFKILFSKNDFAN
mgnify:CR=1 FL=1